MDLTNLSTIKNLLKTENQNAKKYLGQNFLVDKETLELIVKTSEIKKSEKILEVGPGLGVLTQKLSEKAKEVISIELDGSLIPILQKTLSDKKNIKIIEMDALQYEPPKTEYKVVANIPYNITSPLINHFLKRENKPKSITLLVQLEVAEKIVSLDPKMSILSLQIGLFGKAEIIKKINKNCFYPEPKVDSAIIKINVFPKNHPNYIPLEYAQKILKTAKRAFSQKRKKLSNTLSELKTEKTKIDLNRRPETLSIKEWKTIVNVGWGKM